MQVSLERIILFVQDVGRVADFYRRHFGFAPVEEASNDWAVLQADACQLALHRVGEPYRVADASDWQADGNAKLVFSIGGGLDAMRQTLLDDGTAMGAIKSFPGVPGRLCDGKDPEGNVFQLWEAA